MRERYGASARSQMLKYHVQTSGRSLHAQEISFNDIRTTLQALYAMFDNCNSLHTNAFDEAITTPTEQSVRRAVAIQLIISRELGLNFCENPWQGSFVVDEFPSGVVCSVQWIPCISVAKFRKKACITKARSTTAHFPWLA
jgi:methylmalonyl-CoA mutase